MSPTIVSAGSNHRISCNLRLCYLKRENMPPADALRPMCFIAMPFGTRPAQRSMEIDFDRVHQFIRRGAEAAGLEAIRADFEPAGGFIHKPMLERILVAEYVVADLTLANPNVMYE